MKVTVFFLRTYVRAFSGRLAQLLPVCQYHLHLLVLLNRYENLNHTEELKESAAME